jgi:hypothetical protein
LRYNLSEFDEWLPPEPVETTAPASPIGERIPDGKRNGTLASLAGSMRRRGMDVEAIVAALLVSNAQRCDPPLPDDEVRAIAASVARYAPATPAASSGPDSAPTLTADPESAADLGDAAPGPKLLRGAAIFAVTVTEPDWTITRLFSRANQHMLVGSSQSGKTWALWDLAVALADETVATWLGQPIAQHGVVVLESWEQNQLEDVRRLQKLLRGHDRPTAPDSLILLSEPAATLRDADYFATRLRELREWGAIAYLFDSLSEASGLGLQDNGEYTEWWRARIKPILRLGCTVAFTHLKGHVKPGVQQDRDSASRGATQIRALSTGVVEFRQLIDTLFAVRHNKHRDTLALPFGTLALDGAVDDPTVRLLLRAETVGQTKTDLARTRLLTLGQQRPPPGRC